MSCQLQPAGDARKVLSLLFLRRFGDELRNQYVCVCVYLLQVKEGVFVCLGCRLTQSDSQTSYLINIYISMINR